MEVAKNIQPLFIGVQIIKINQHLQTSVWRKNTKASPALSESPQDSRYKRSLLKTMFDREIACLLRNIFSCKKKKKRQLELEKQQSGLLSQSNTLV